MKSYYKNWDHFDVDAELAKVDTNENMGFNT
eukprot:CAMPEP_0116893022 /NCGR_PEP_ID=MMETSP0467-20121206/3104_1 /TAXON_ID=283647 /ORGANISM="Mesodinium pulex, Strain SPMC105" /LENGTH=30 /DNA_ID= /DNA_START= /DNA_END= /DNA_ORIENTATION=